MFEWLEFGYCWVFGWLESDLGLVGDRTTTKNEFYLFISTTLSRVSKKHLPNHLKKHSISGTLLRLAKVKSVIK